MKSIASHTSIRLFGPQIFFTFLCVCFFVLLSRTSTSAQSVSSAEHPIDRRISECKTKDPTPLGLIGCDLQGYQAWTAEMERIYGILIRKLPPTGQEKLKQQQLHWLKMRDAQLAFNNWFYEGKGHDGLLMIASAKTDLLRRRALDLETYLGFIEPATKP